MNWPEVNPLRSAFSTTPPVQIRPFDPKELLFSFVQDALHLESGCEMHGRSVEKWVDFSWFELIFHWFFGNAKKSKAQLWEASSKSMRAVSIPSSFAWGPKLKLWSGPSLAIQDGAKSPRDIHLYMRDVPLPCLSKDIAHNWLVVYLPLWKISKSVERMIPNIRKNKQCSKPPTRKYN